ncbi:hypothetical protein L9F63_001335, partial [Diploptera punctata]
MGDLKHNISGIFCSILMICMLIFGMICIVIRYQQTNQTDPGEIVSYTFCQPLNFIVAFLTIVLNVSGNRTKIVALITRLSVINGLLDNYSRLQSTKSRNLNFNKMALVMITGIIIPFLLYDSFNYGRNYSHVLSILLRFSHFLNVVIMLQFCKFVKIIQNSLTKLINIMKTYDINTQRIGELKKMWNKTRKIQVSDIVTLRRLYNDIFETVQLLNHVYGCPILLEFLRQTIGLTVNFYYMIKYFYNLEEYTFIQPYFLISKLLWLAMFLSMILCTTVFCHLGMLESRKLSSQIQKNLLQFPMDKEIIYQLQLFSGQVSENKINFTAFWFLQIDISLLCTALATAVTYIVILIQLK